MQHRNDRSDSLRPFRSAPSRRDALRLLSCGFGLLALRGLAAGGQSARPDDPLAPKTPHHAARAKRVIFLFMSGGPSQIELFDYKPGLSGFAGKDLPESVRNGQRLTQMSATQSSFPMVPSKFSFARHGQSGAWVSELLPRTAAIADRLAFIKSMHTEAINHDPAITFFQTGSQNAGRPSFGAWLGYGLGSDNRDLPAFCVLVSKSPGDQPL